MKTKHSKLISISIALILVMVSCSSPESNVIKNDKSQVKEINTEADVPEIDSLFTEEFELNTEENTGDGIQLFKLDNEKSLVTWFCVTHTGYVKFKSGQLSMLDNKIVSGEFEIAMDSIRDTDIDYDLMRIVLENTLKSDSFFNVKTYPVSIIKLTHVKKIESNKYLVGANLFVNGKNSNVRLQTQIISNDSSLLVLTDRFYIDRTKWGVTIYSRNFEQTDESFLFTDSVSMKVTAVLNRIN